MGETLHGGLGIEAAVQEKMAVCRRRGTRGRKK